MTRLPGGPEYGTVSVTRTYAPASGVEIEPPELVYDPPDATLVLVSREVLDSLAEQAWST